jgi:hypothetical protein
MDEGDEKMHQGSGDDGRGKGIWRTGLALTPANRQRQDEV